MTYIFVTCLFIDERMNCIAKLKKKCTYKIGFLNDLQDNQKKLKKKKN